MEDQTVKEKTLNYRFKRLFKRIVLYLFFVSLLYSSVFFIVPFLPRVMNHTLAKWLWYSAFAVWVFVIVLIFWVNQTKQKDENNKQERNQNVLTLLSFLWLTFIFSFIFFCNYYTIVRWKNPFLIPIVAALFLLSLLPFSAANEYNEKHGMTKGELFDFIKNNLYAVFTALFLGLLGIAISQQLIPYIFAFGVPSIVLLFWKLVYDFLSTKPVKLFARTYGTVSSIISFCFLIGLTVYLLYLIPENYKNLQNILITIIAAVFGGSITLVGVAWTIRQGQKERAEDRKQLEEDRKQEEIKKAKPIFTFSMLFEEEHQIKQGEKICFPADMPDRRYKMNAVIENSDRAPFEMKRLYLDGKWYDIEGNTVVLPNRSVIFHFQFENFLYIFLEVNDALGNPYYYEMKVVSWKFDGKYPNFHYTLREIKEISFEDVQMKIEERNKKYEELQNQEKQTEDTP